MFKLLLRVSTMCSLLWLLAVPARATTTMGVDAPAQGARVLSLRRVQVPDTRDASGRMPSDHRPVLATLDVR